MDIKNCNNKNKGGYTIIETMIAVSLFVIIVTMGTNALLNASVIHQKSNDMRSIMDSLSFIMEDMSRNLRTGYNYHCVDDGILTSTTAHSCAYGGGISFRSTLYGAQWVYYIDNTGKIYKSTSGGVAGTFVQLTPDEVVVNPISGFAVLGAEAPSGDTQQPLVTIRLSGTITLKGVVTPFYLQTSVSQRQVDI